MNSPEPGDLLLIGPATLLTRTTRRLPSLLLVAALVSAACSAGEPAVDPDPTASPSVTASATQTPSEDATSPPVAGEPPLFAYRFPDGTIDLEFVQQPTRIEAVAAFPSGPGPFPVALVVHGVGHACSSAVDAVDLPSLVTEPWSPPCTREGSDYVRPMFAGTAIVQALAAQGVAAVAFDVNAAYNWWGGEVPEGQVQQRLAALHLAILGDIASGVVEVDGVASTVALDLDRVALVGHSRGGVFAEAQLSPPDEQQDRLDFQPSAVVLLGSAGHYNTPDLGVPTLNVRSKCDEDVGAEAGQATAAAIATAGGSPVVDVVLTGASHWSMTSYPVRATSIDCADPLTDPRRSEAQVAALTAAFLSAVLTGRDVVLPIDANIAMMDVLSGQVTQGALDGTPRLDPHQIVVQFIDQERLPPIDPAGRFLDEETLEDF